MKHLLLALLLIVLSLNSMANSPDLSGKYGLSIALGQNRPILGNEFDDRADSEFVFGMYGRYQINRESGLQLGYTRYEWDHSPTAARIYDLVYMHRLTPREYFTPIWGAGLGLVDIANYNVDENLKLGIKARAGIEYTLSRYWIADFVIDYQFVNKMIGESDNLTIGEIHALSAQVIFTYFFGQR